MAVTSEHVEEDTRWESHDVFHGQLSVAIDKAEVSQQAALRAALADHHREHEVHASAHEREHIAHGREHGMAANALDKAAESAEAALNKALNSADSALKTALDDHHREHLVHETAHSREHAMNAEAIRVAGVSMDVRLASLNEFREQLREQARNFASSERVDALAKELDRRVLDSQALANSHYEGNRQRIETLEKGDAKGEGKGIGQSQVVGYIIAAVSVTGVVVGLIVKISGG